ncbi:MAG: outer membrane lipoprotein-sorting protein [Methanomicrobiales archaeon]|nr:outer membrane lipoprotein-sorting protein [Methanomicrobiales archaeon]
MKKIYPLLFLLAFSLSLNAQNNARDIMQKARLRTQLKGLEAVSTLIIRNPKGNERVRTTALASKSYPGDIEKRLIRFLEPADVRGMGMLIVDYEDRDDDMWVYMPSSRKSRRIVSTEKSKSFMGSEFSNADMSAPLLDDFNFSLLGEEKIGEQLCWKIRSTPINREKEDEYGFQYRISWVSKSEYINLRSENYDFEGRLHKVVKITGYVMLDKKNEAYLVTEMQIENKLNGRNSTMIMQKYEYNPNVPDRYFTVSFLENF